MTLREFVKKFIQELSSTGNYVHLTSRPRKGGGIEIIDHDLYRTEPLVCTVESTRRIVEEYRVGRMNEFRISWNDLNENVTYEYGTPKYDLN